MSMQELEMMASELLREFEGGTLERHEVHEKLRQTLDQMRAFGMPLPQDLVDLEKELAGEFVQEAHKG
ncbi:MAG: hypothetical protein COB59_04770 [Rhodospirillaceae bacterium]|nr:MAG: hypothetical protein COB59_04770 [Rhodospirillaceae bacterium]